MCIIGLDLDDTLTYMPIRVIDQAAENLGIERYDPIVHDYWFSTVSESHKKEIMRLFVDPKFMGSVQPIPGVQAKLREWANKHNLIIITAREESIHEVTRQLVADYFPRVSEIHFVHIQESKAKLMRDLHLEAWIDDAPHGIKQSLELKLPTYLVSNENTLYNHEARELLPNCRIVPNVTNVVLDKPCPWCSRLPRLIYKSKIAGDSRKTFGCAYIGCPVHAHISSSLDEEEIIECWNSMELLS